MEILIISCIFGKTFKKIYPAPKFARSSIPLEAVEGNGLVTLSKCLFFTNNPTLKQEIESKGWTPVFINMPLSNNSIVSSIQSKYIKFLQFLNNDRFKQLKEQYTKILYFDHKFYVQPHHINKLINLTINTNINIIIRETPTLKTSIWSEVNAAKEQER